MKKIFLISLICVGIIVLTGCTLVEFSSSGDIKDDVDNKNMNIVTSLEDKIGDNTVWCGTFNLIWNDLKNDIAKQDIKFTVNSDVVNNLNKGTFTINELSESSYYKTYGTPTLELKAEIEKAIKDKFNETSDILDSFNWEGHTEKDYFLYSMLKKDFEYPKVFDKLENGNFENYSNVRYFGVTGKSNNQIKEQLDVLYYNSENDFAIKIKTKSEDEIIVTVGNEEDNFLDMYNNIMIESGKYKDSIKLRDGDTFKMPYITFDLKEEITEVENKPFLFSNGDEYIIEMALQAIEFELDEKGGKVKSEAGMMVNKTTSIRPQEPRKFNVDKAFTIFLVEHGKKLPYFAAKISDISSVQSGVNINEEHSGNSTSAYIPDGMEVATKDEVEAKPEEIIVNREKEKVTVEVLLNTVTPSSATIVVTDKNKTSYGWGKSYKLQQKIADDWLDMAPIAPMAFEEIAYILDENGQFKQNIDWSRFYGDLGKGKFRIVKDTYDKGYIYFYSNEFEIK